MTAADRVSIVIPVHDGAAMTGLCLDTVLTEAPGAQVIVVDDGSRDETAALLATYGDRIRCSRNDRNRGYAVTCNRGAELADREFLLLLNNDAIIDPSTVAELVRAADSHPGDSIFGSKLLFPDGTVQHAGVVFNQFDGPYHLYEGFPADHPAVNKERRFQVVTAACMLIRRELYVALGGFDEGFINSAEDVDLCLRAGACGHRVRYVPTSVAVHRESVSRGRDGDYIRQSAAGYFQRWSNKVVRDDLSFLAADGLLTVAYQAGGRVRIGVDPSVGGTLESGTTEAELYADRVVGHWLKSRDHAIRAGIGVAEVPIPLVWDSVGNPHRAAREREWTEALGRLPLDTADYLRGKVVPLNLQFPQRVRTRLNILYEGLDESILFGGHTGMLQWAAQLALAGERVRLIGVDVPGRPSPELWDRAAQLPGCEGLSDVEYLDASDRRSPVPVSSQDTFMATSWWTMHMADRAAARCSAPPPVWLQQEYEPVFYPNGSYQAMARAAYDLPHRSVISTELLRRYFQDQRVGVYGAVGGPAPIVFDNPITCLDRVTADLLDRPPPHRILLYLRSTNRNLSEMLLAGLETAEARGTLPEDWLLTSAGGDFGGLTELRLTSGRPITLYSRLRPARYLALLGAHDVGVALQDSPHPGLVALDMAGSGLTAITSTYGPTKDAASLAALSGNLFPVPPTPDAIADAVEAAIARTPDFAARAAGADFAWPRTAPQAYPQSLIDQVRALIHLNC